MKRLSYLMVALAAYSVFTLTFLYLIAFLADVPAIPRSIDRPTQASSTVLATAIDVALIAVFGVQHSVMARKGFKAAWTRIVPEPIERSAYLIFTCLALILLFALWQPLPSIVWEVKGAAARPMLWTIFAMGWLVVFLSTYLINHFEMFGLTQAWAHWRSIEPAPPQFRQPLFYRLVRHPLYSGFLLAFWATPTMSWGHLLFAAAMSVYILIAIEFEERDLVASFGAEYQTYRLKVGKVIPGIR